MPVDVLRPLAAVALIEVAVAVVAPSTRSAATSIVLVVLVGFGVRWVRVLLTLSYAVAATFAVIGTAWLAFHGWRVPADDVDIYASTLLGAAALLILRVPAVVAWTAPASPRASAAPTRTDVAA